VDRWRGDEPESSKKSNKIRKRITKKLPVGYANRCLSSLCP